MSRSSSPGAGKANAAGILWREGSAALRRGDSERAAILLARMLRLAPGHADAWNSLGVALRRLGRSDAAVPCFRRALALSPGMAEAAAGNLGNVLRDLGRFAESEAAFRRAMAAGGGPGTRYNYSLLLRDRNRLDAAIAMIEPALAAEPENRRMVWDYALMLLQKGDWARGFTAYEARWNLPGVPPPASHAPRWGGEPPGGRALAVLCEQGMGDMVQFARYVPLIPGDGDRLILQVRAPLLPLLSCARELAGAVFVDREKPLPSHDLYVPIMSLPGLVDARPDAVPPPLSFALPGAARSRAAAMVPVRQGRRRIGIVWAGSAGHRNDRNRSAGLEAFLPVLGNPDWDVFSFQVGNRAADLAFAGLSALCTDLAPRLEDFLDTAAFLTRMDAVLAVDTCVAHVAGSLGVPTWIILPEAVDWRWNPDSGNTRWYPSVRIVRQNRQGDWESPIALARQQMTEVLARCP